MCSFCAARISIISKISLFYFKFLQPCRIKISTGVYYVGKVVLPAKRNHLPTENFVYALALAA